MVGAGIDCQSNCHECPKLCTRRALSSKFESNFKETLRGQISILWTRNRAYSKFNAKYREIFDAELKKIANLQALLDAMFTLVDITNPHLAPSCHLVVVHNNHPHCHFVNSSQISIKAPCVTLSSQVPWPTCLWKVPRLLKQVGRGALRHLVTISKKTTLTLFHLVNIYLSTPCALPQPIL